MTPNIEEISNETQEHVHPKDLPKLYEDPNQLYPIRSLYQSFLDQLVSY